MLKRLFWAFAGFFTINKVLESNGQDTLIDMMEDLDLDELDLADFTPQNMIEDGVHSVMQGPMDNLKDTLDDLYNTRP